MILPIDFPTIETERVFLRLLTMQDREQVFEHFSDESVTEFMDIEPCRSIEEAREIIQFHLNDTGCRWGLFRKCDHKLLGTCGYHCWTTGIKSKAEIGFDLSKSYWGKGYMREVLTPVIHFGFTDMELQLIEATVDPRNVRCSQLLRKLGFVMQGQLENNLLLFTLQSPSS